MVATEIYHFASFLFENGKDHAIPARSKTTGPHTDHKLNFPKLKASSITIDSYFLQLTVATEIYHFTSFLFEIGKDHAIHARLKTLKENLYFGSMCGCCCPLSGKLTRRQSKRLSLIDFNASVNNC